MIGVLRLTHVVTHQFHVAVLPAAIRSEEL